MYTTVDQVHIMPMNLNISYPIAADDINSIHVSLIHALYVVYVNK